VSGVMSPRENPVRGISPEEAERLVRDDMVRILDVRSAEEYRSLGHIPGSLLLPVDLVASAPATLPREGKPLLVCCEHGVRSAAAARFLSRAGFEEVWNMSGGMSRWKGPRDYSAGDPFGPAGPASWLVENADLLPRGGEVLDVACGAGRNALLLASAGLRVKGVDWDPSKIEALNATARRLALPLAAEVLDLETLPAVDLGEGRYDLVVVVHYLHRPLFPALTRALRRGGILLVETFTREQALKEQGPSNPDFLLEPGELPLRVSPLKILREREGEFQGRSVSSIVARKD
jgi:tellurite methyltransferase